MIADAIRCSPVDEFTEGRGAAVEVAAHDADEGPDESARGSQDDALEDLGEPGDIEP